MRFSTHGSAAVAMAASLASATVPVERSLLNLDTPSDLSEPITASVDIGVDLSGTTLVAGVVANIALPPVVGAAAEVEVAVVCDTCFTKGTIDASISLANVVPALSLKLSNIEAKLDLDVYLSAAAVIAVNLFTPEAPIKLSLPGLNVDALVYLDLVIGAHTEIDLSAGIDVKLADEAHIETDILAGKILDAAFSGLSVQVLPIEVRIGCTEVIADLRLRVELGVAAEVDIDDVLPILDLPEIGAGLEVAVFANLLEYVGFFCATPSCPLSTEKYGLNIGAAVELDVAVEDLLNLHLAPSISTELLTQPIKTICEHPDYTPTAIPTPTGPGISFTGTAHASIPGGAPPATITGPPGTPSGYNGGDVVTSTITNAQTFTITQCAVNVPNCPAGYQTTATLVHTTVYTTICPATQTQHPANPPQTKTQPPVTVTKEVVTLVPCSTVETFTPPSEVPTPPYPTGGYSTPAKPTGGASTPRNTPTGGEDYPAETPAYPAESTSVDVPHRTPTGGASTSVDVPHLTPTGGAEYPSTAVDVPHLTPTGGASTSVDVPHLTPTGGLTPTPSYPVGGGGEPPIATAAAAKVGSGVAGVLAVAGAFLFM
ncbi:uncharacterized protein GGS25DRAFT_348026 [Hypoxylon fragiforme]|uniref:uncharacterized protein n=1 Tax=Hypoxylon fragiforme TaxID=63214 RepID=UPI0020C715AC|nr:uncharacterized protein GGS25DRAFT_348026 [Hypoxylon fragiforme]KAI2607714.1 hypothetical protein GGS25DRAFT_348026 [Hypoxylon fragiforme]